MVHNYDCVCVMLCACAFFHPDNAYSNNFYTKGTSAKQDWGEEKACS